MSKKSDAAFAALYAKGVAAGMCALVANKPVPMMVVEHSNPMNDASPAKRAWYVSEGACGFAWVNVSPGNSPFANWLKKNGKARKSYEGGVSIWVSEGGQSVDRKKAYADAMAKVFVEAGVKAYAMDRLD